ncbi:glutamyl-tRNA reductase [Streptomyces sp. NPDC051105]|uniref:glutamyl-tRNA reductase n=1 Tax=Streptomyces sp. NPDC051105 TaxID=3154843 RepID=UPI00342DBC20
MSVLAIGLSHNSAPMALLNRVSVTGDTLGKLLHDVALAEPVAEVFVVSTCNRIEVYADVDRFHAGVTVICELLARHSGVPLDDLTPHLYVHYEDRAVSHLLTVACGLDSMVVGEEQVVGQVRAAIRLAAREGTIGRVLGDLGRVALRAGKRTRAETGIGRAGAGLLGLAVELAAPRLGERGLTGRDVLVVGAGSMSALAVATAARSGAATIVVANRTRRKAERLAARPGASLTRVVGLGDLPSAMAEADVVICCTGAAGYVITADMVRVERCGGLVLLDLAMPRDVEPAVADLPGVTVIGMDALRENRTGAATDDLAAVRAILETELAAYRSAVDAARVAPLVVALRARAVGVVDAELARLTGRLGPDAPSGRVLAEMAQSMRRVVDKLLHEPTVRVKELAGSPKGEDYAAALGILFDLDPCAVQAVTRAPTPGQEELP